FENTAAGLAVEKGYKYVICGHIHQPEMREISLEEGKVLYLNSGDWVESLTSLEYHQGKWNIYRHAAGNTGDLLTESEDLLDGQDLNALLDIKSLYAQFTGIA